MNGSLGGSYSACDTWSRTFRDSNTLSAAKYERGFVVLGHWLGSIKTNT